MTATDSAAPVKPMLRGWMHLIWFEASLVIGTCLVTLWTLTLTACAIHMVWMNAPELLVGSTFVGLGWVGVLALPGVWVHSGVAAATLLIAGGLLYTIGALSYRRRWPDPNPAVFGYHEVFHVYVGAAAACLYAAIALFIA